MLMRNHFVSDGSATFTVLFRSDHFALPSADVEYSRDIDNSLYLQTSSETNSLLDEATKLYDSFGLYSILYQQHRADEHRHVN